MHYCENNYQQRLRPQAKLSRVVSYSGQSKLNVRPWH